MHVWQKQAFEIEAAHNKKIQEHGQVQVNRGGKSGWSIRDTAKYLGISVGAASENLRLAKFLRYKPHSAQIPLRKDALNQMHVWENARSQR